VKKKYQLEFVKWHELSHEPLVENYCSNRPCSYTRHTCSPHKPASSFQLSFIPALTVNHTV